MNCLDRPRLLAPALTFGLAALLSGFPNRAFSAPPLTSVPASIARAFKPPVRTKECLDIPFAHTKKANWYCKIDAGGSQKPSFFVFGDSHGLQLVSAFDAAARAAGRTGQFAGFSGCVPLLGTYPLTRPDQATQDCHALNDRVLAHVRSQRFKHVFLVAKWSYYTDFWNGTQYLNGIGLSPSDPVSLENTRLAFEKGFRDTVAAYQKLGVRLYVVEQVPQQLYAPAEIYKLVASDPLGARQRLKELSTPLPRHLALQAFSRNVFKTHGTPTATQPVNFDPLFCDEQVCRVGTTDTSYYEDPSHLSQDGAELTVPTLTALLSAIRPAL